MLWDACLILVVYILLRIVSQMNVSEIRCADARGAVHVGCTVSFSEIMSRLTAEIMSYLHCIRSKSAKSLHSQNTAYNITQLTIYLSQDKYLHKPILIQMMV